MPAVKGTLETAIYVSDLSKAAEFYKRLFNFRAVFENERLIALDVAPCNVLLLFPVHGTDSSVTLPGGVIPPHGPGGPGHFAFLIAAADLDTWEDHLNALQVPIESKVHWDEGSTSIYFRDLDRNLVELATPGLWANCKS